MYNTFTYNVYRHATTYVPVHVGARDHIDYIIFLESLQKKLTLAKLAKY